MKQFLYFVQKEFFHIFRDRRTMLILLVMPILLVLLFGYAITTEVKNTRLAFMDQSKDEVSQLIKERFAANRYFTIVDDISDHREIERLFLRDEIDMVIVLEQGLAGNVVHLGKASIQILVDGTEPNQASVREGYARQVLASVAHEQSLSGASSQMNYGTGVSYQIIPTTRMLYNPQQKSEYNFVPGVIGVILLLICVMMSSISIVREREMGTMEVLLASPLPAGLIVLAKLVPYFTISCVNMVTILLLSVFLLHVPIAGSLLCFVGVTLLYILVALSLGLLVSTLVKTQLAAMLLSILLIVPSIYLSGLAFAIDSMPEALQRASCFFPPRWYILAAKKLLIQGVSPIYVLKESVILASMLFVLLGVAWSRFKTRLE